MKEEINEEYALLARVYNPIVGFTVETTKSFETEFEARSAANDLKQKDPDNIQVKVIKATTETILEL